jgi:hypothetical protein
MDDRPPIRPAGANSLGPGWLFPLIGWALLLAATVGYYVSVVRWWGAERTEGTVVAFEREVEDGETFFPIVEYAAGGRQFRCTGSFGWSPPKNRVGDRVGVLYQADRPAEAVIDTFWDRWGAWALLAFGGLLFVLISRGMQSQMQSPECARAAESLAPTGPGEPAFRDEMGVRAYALGGLGCMGAILAGFFACAGLLPWILGIGSWWVWLVAVFCGLALVSFVATLGPLLVRGGTYRVVVQDGRLRVDSPSRTLGPSFDVPLTSVQRLAIRKVSEGLERYEVQTRSGEIFEMNAPCAERLFEAIRELYPEIPVGWTLEDLVA